MRRREARKRTHEAWKAEARAILEGEISRLRATPYEELMALMGVTARNVLRDSGNEFTLEVNVFWDDPREQRDLRVAVDVDGIVRRRVHARGGFVKAPDGSFIGE